MIDHVMLINLKRRTDKWFFALGHLQALGYPVEGDERRRGDQSWSNNIIRFEAHDGQDYKDIQSVIAAAVADGFAFFGNFYDACEKDYDLSGDNVEIRKLCWRWTYAAALRAIEEMNKRVMLLIDDILPVQNWDWDRLNRLVVECVEADRHHGRRFKGLQLRYKCSPDRRLPETPYYGSMLREGLWGINENGYVFSRSGARMFFNTYKEKFPLEIIAAGEEIARRGVTNKRYRSGWWTVRDEAIKGNYVWKSNLWGAA